METICLNPYIIDLTNDCEDEAIIYNRRRKKAYSLGKLEYKVFSLINGHNTIKFISDCIDGYSYEEVSELIGIFKKLDFIKVNNKFQSRPKINIFHFKIGIVCPEKFLEKNKMLVTYVSNFVKYGFLISFVIGIIKFDFQKLFNNFKNQELLETGILSIVFMIIVLVVHEISHACRAKHVGGKVAEFGIELYCFLPIAYTSVCGQSRLSKKEIISYLLAGIEMNLFVVGITLILIKSIPSGYENTILISILIANIVPIIGNFSIFYKFDFYYIIAVLLERPNLYEESNIYVKNFFSKKITKDELSHLEKSITLMYGLYNKFSELVLIIFTIAVMLSKIKLL